MTLPEVFVVSLVQAYWKNGQVMSLTILFVLIMNASSPANSLSFPCHATTYPNSGRQYARLGMAMTVRGDNGSFDAKNEHFGTTSTYDVVGGVEHVGGTDGVNSGHYTAIVSIDTFGNFVKYDDDARVRLLTVDDVELAARDGGAALFLAVLHGTATPNDFIIRVTTQQKAEADAYFAYPVMKARSMLLHDQASALAPVLRQWSQCVFPNYGATLAI